MHSTGGESRSSTPGSGLDTRVMFSSHASPLPPQHTSITSYPSASSPSVMTASPAMYYGTKYLPSSTPPEAHRYSSDSFRVSSEATDQERYIIDPSRISLDPYRQLHGDGASRAIHSDFQRIRVDDQIAETYHRPVEDIYGSPVDLQRVPETNQQLITAQRLVSELQKMHADSLRSASSEQTPLRHVIPIDSISPTESSNYRVSLQNAGRNSSESNFRSQESTLRTHSDPQRLVQESFKDFFPPSESPKPSLDILRLSVDHRSAAENGRYMLSDVVRSEPQSFSDNLSIPRNLGSDNLRVNVNNSREIISEDLRTGAHTPHNGLPEHLRIETDGMLPDNLRAGASTPQSLGPENLRLVHETPHSMIPENVRLRSTHSMVIENHRVGTDGRHILMPENLRLVSDLSQNIDGLRGETDVVSHRVMSENLIGTADGSHNLMPENLHVGSGTPHNLIPDNLRLGGSETPHSMAPENLIRVGNETPHAMMPENLRIVSNSSHSLIANHLRFSSENSRNSLTENLRLVTDNHHGLIPENLRVTSEASRMVPENLCLAEPTHQVLPEDLHISHAAINGGSISNSLDHQNARILTHDQSSDSSLPIMRSHYDSSAHRIMIDNPHSIRVQSPHYSDVYRSDLQDNLNSTNPTTPAPPIQMGDVSGTPQYYPSYSSIHNNHYANYINDECDDRDGMSLQEKINRGYHDIKPFDQNYPVPLTMMHMPQETIQPPQSVAKPPKLKKPKEPKPPRLPVIHKCVECLRVFKNSTQLKNHMWRHTGEKPFTCDECGSKFTQQGNLRAHRRIHTGERPYECLECKTSFTQLSTLKTHQKIHSDERPYQCNECDAAFRQIANLKTHQVTHTGERPHKCDLCDKAFTQKSNLKAHKNRVHVGDGHSAPAKRGRKKNPVAIKPYNCPDCGAKFTMISNLKIHSKLHAGNKPFECDYCGAGFAQRSNMKTHIQRMHGKIPGAGRRRIRCDECPAMFRLKRCLKTHKKRRHPIKSLKIKILRESKYLMNSGSPASAVQEGDEMDEDDDEDDDDEDDDDDDDGDIDDDEEESDEEILESQLLTKKCKNDDKSLENCSHGNVSTDVREPIIEIKEPKVEPMDEDQYRSLNMMEESGGGKREDSLQTKRNTTEEDENSTSSKENDGSVKQRWEGRFNIKEEIQQSPGNESRDHSLVSSNTS